MLWFEMCYTLLLHSVRCRGVTIGPRSALLHLDERLSFERMGLSVRHFTGCSSEVILFILRAGNLVVFLMVQFTVARHWYASVSGRIYWSSGCVSQCLRHWQVSDRKLGVLTEEWRLRELTISDRHDA